MSDTEFNLSLLDNETLHKIVFLKHILYDNYSTFEQGSEFTELYHIFNKYIIKDTNIQNFFNRIEPTVFERYINVLNTYFNLYTDINFFINSKNVEINSYDAKISFDVFIKMKNYVEECKKKNNRKKFY